MKDKMCLEFESKSENEKFARMAVATFIARLDPTIGELEDIKTAVSEAVTNAIIHGYDDENGQVIIECELTDNDVTIIVKDKGVGIENLEEAMEPLYTSKPEEERSGMGFSFMEIFMDELNVRSKLGEGTIVTMKKYLGKEE